MSDLADMAAFVAVVEQASFTDAATRLSTSKSVVSRRISDLERTLGAVLLDRSARYVRPTEIGAVYYAKCVRILEAVESANEFVSSANGTLQGRLRVVVPELLATVFVPLLSRFSAAQPRIVPEVVVADGAAADAHFDAALQCGELHDSSLVARSLGVLSWVLCASPVYIARAGRPESCDALAAHDGLLLSTGDHQGGWPLLQGAELRNGRVRERLRSNSAAALRQAACDGLGIALLPRLLVETAIEAGELESLLPDLVPPPMPLFLVYPRSRRASQKVQVLQSFLVDALAAQPPRSAKQPATTAGP